MNMHQFFYNLYKNLKKLMKILQKIPKNNKLYKNYFYKLKCKWIPYNQKFENNKKLIYKI